MLVSLTKYHAPYFRLPAPAGWAVPHAMTAIDLDGAGRFEVLVLRLDSGIDPQRKGGPVLLGRVVDPDRE